MKDDKKIENEIKNNNTKKKEKVEKVIKKLNIEATEREKKNISKKKKKNLFLSIGIVLELMVIILIIKFTYVKKEPKTFEVTCSNTSSNVSTDYTITMNNVYYFDSKNNVNKTANSIIYIFKEKDKYLEYKKKYINSDIKDFDGIEQITIFDDVNYVFENRTTYTYDILKKNKNVKVNDKILEVNLKERKEPMEILLENYDEVIERNEQLKFVCE